MREMNFVARVPQGTERQDRKGAGHESSVRLSVNLSNETAQTFRALIRHRGLSITEGIRRAIAVWKFVEDETSKGNQLAVIEHDDSIRKVVLL
jgi:hypothetical protein